MIRTGATKLVVSRSTATSLASRVRPAVAVSCPASRAYATATATSSSSSHVSLPPLGNIEAAWADMPPQEQESVFNHLESLQKKDWKELTLEEKKASYFVSFGPHGPRAPLSPPGSGAKVIGGITASIVAAIALYAGIRHFAPEPPRTMTKEWQEASMEYAKEHKMDPFTGPASQNQKKGTYVQSK